ncbi:aminotransferase class V-fold PLP-dependent enzyme [Fundidesulfovibrio butyratiphilus]
MLDCQRHRFDIPEDVAYLDCAHTSPLPLAAERAGIEAMARRRQPWNMAADVRFAGLEAARRGFATLLGAPEANVAVVGSVSYAMAVAAKNLSLEPGQKVVVLDGQFPSNVHPWRKVPGAVVVPVPRPAEGTWSRAVEDAVTADVGLVALPHCHWIDGTVFDLAAIRVACDRVGARLAVDATQSAGMLPLDLAAVRPDVLAVTAHKWLLCPYGVAFLYLADQWLDGEPLEENWFNRQNAEDFSGSVQDRMDYRPGARRYDMGQVGDGLRMAMVAASLDLMNAWGATALSESLRPKITRLAAAGQAFGLIPTPVGERAPHLLGLALPHGRDARPLAADLARMGVHVGARGTRLRLACHAFVSDGDVERCITALARGLST